MIPEELIARPQWLIWHLAQREGKSTKIPVDPHNGGPGKVDDPATWGSYELACAARGRFRCTGVGFVFTVDDPYVGVDLDHCRDRESGQVSSEAQAIIDRFGTYAEVSVSGCGVHLVLCGSMPSGSRHRGRIDGLEVEVYEAGRYFVMTGEAILTAPAGERHGSAISVCQDELDELCARLSHHGEHLAPPVRAIPPAEDLSDDEVLRRASAAANGAKFSRLWAGDASDQGGDASAADLALASMLAYWCRGGLGQMDRIFRRSALMRPKWDERHYADGATYGERTLQRSLEQLPATKATEATEAPAETATWPRPLAGVAFHGPMGRLVAALEPHTEADSAALLVNGLVAVGCLVGSDAHLLVGNDRHPARLFAALVGETAKARKGTSWGPIRDALASVDATWIERVMDGLASGEGLIWAVRDQIHKPGMRKSKDGPGSEAELVDAGVADKRLLVVEGEFARVLSVMSRPDNTLSAIVRSAWDTGSLRVLTRNSPAKASGAHICIIGHITKGELLAKLSSNEAGNGFGNRFLWVCVRRSKVLPFGGQPDAAELVEVVADLRRVRQFARVADRLAWSDEAKVIWRDVYPDLSEGHPGLEGALTARAEAQVLRIALIYALLDRSQTIMPEHLWAALEVWRYCAESAAYIFGKRCGDPIADEILSELRKRGSLDRTAIRDLFSKHQNVARINEALNVLQSLGRVRVEQVATEGRPREVWHAL